LCGVALKGAFDDAGSEIFAISVVRSTEPLSKTMISSQQRRLSMARAMLCCSLKVMMVAEMRVKGPYGREWE
jgi:ABC-type branched-subunit amino acid transport system ATPase component